MPIIYEITLVFLYVLVPTVDFAIIVIMIIIITCFCCLVGFFVIIHYYYYYCYSFGLVNCFDNMYMYVINALIFMTKCSDVIRGLFIKTERSPCTA